MSIQEKLYSADDLWELSHLPENREKRLELSEGRLIEMSPSGNEHGLLTHRIGLLIGMFVEEHDLGEVTGAESGYILYTDENGKATVRGPDVGFIRKERFGHPLERYFTSAPDLAVEIAPADGTAVEFERKINHYLCYGTPMLIAVYPKSKTIYVYRPTTVYRLTMDDTLDGGDVLPGFSLPVRKLFKW